jgi:hypothetical protein
MSDNLTAALIAAALLLTGTLAGIGLSSVADGATTVTVTATPPVVTVTAPPVTVRVTERASRSHSRGSSPRPSSTTSTEGNRAGVPVDSARVSDYTMTMDPAMNARLWELIAACESSGNWHATGGSFSGGLQFLPSTWAANGGGQFAPTAAQASKSEQIAVANRLSSGGDWLKPWPVCGKRAATTLGMRFP